MQSSSILRAAEGHVIIDSVGGWGEAGDAVVIDYAGCWGWGCVIIINSAGGGEGGGCSRHRVGVRLEPGWAQSSSILRVAGGRRPQK